MSNENHYHLRYVQFLWVINVLSYLAFPLPIPMHCTSFEGCGRKISFSNSQVLLDVFQSITTGVQWCTWQWGVFLVASGVKSDVVIKNVMLVTVIGANEMLFTLVYARMHAGFVFRQKRRRDLIVSPPEFLEQDALKNAVANTGSGICFYYVDTYIAAITADFYPLLWRCLGVGVADALVNIFFQVCFVWVLKVMKFCQRRNLVLNDDFIEERGFSVRETIYSGVLALLCAVLYILGDELGRFFSNTYHVKSEPEQVGISTGCIFAGTAGVSFFASRLYARLKNGESEGAPVVRNLALSVGLMEGGGQ